MRCHDVRSVGKPCSSTTVSPPSGPASSTSKVSPSRVKVVRRAASGATRPSCRATRRSAGLRGRSGRNLRSGARAGTYRGDMPDTTAHLRTGRRWWHVSGTGLFFAAAYVLISISPSLLPRTWYYQGMITGLCAAAGYALGVVLAWLVRTMARRHRPAGHGERRGAALAPRRGAGLRRGGRGRRDRVQRALAGAHRRGRGADPAQPARLGAGPAARGRHRRRPHRAGARPARHDAPARRGGRPRPAQDDRVGDRRRRRRARERVGDRQRRLPPRHAGLRRHGGAGELEPACRIGRPRRRRCGRVAPGRSRAMRASATRGRCSSRARRRRSRSRPPRERGAIEPIRVYAGRSPDESVARWPTPSSPSCKRTNAFSRSVLAVFTTTGTGWVDDWSAQSIEYLSNGDSAIAAMQYSYLPSALSMMTDRETPREAGKALFDRVYAVWLHAARGQTAPSSWSAASPSGPTAATRPSPTRPTWCGGRRAASGSAPRASPRSPCR